MVQSLINSQGGQFVNRQAKSTRNWRTRITLRSVVEAKVICHDRSKCNKVITAYPVGKRDVMYVCIDSQGATSITPMLKKR